MSINTNTMRRGGAYEGDQRAKLPVYDSGIESGNLVINMDHPMRELYLSNDSTAYSLTLNISGASDLSLDFELRPYETINERFPEFEKITVTASEGWRWYVRSGRIT